MARPPKQTKPTTKADKKSDKKDKDTKEKKNAEPTVGSIKEYLRKVIAEHAKTLKREKILDLIYMNRGLGVGNMKAFVDEFDNGFNRTKSKADSTYYGEDFNERPRLRKVSTETSPPTDQAKKDAPKNNNKSGGKK